MKFNKLIKKMTICILTTLLSMQQINFVTNINALDDTSKNPTSTREATPESAFGVSTNTKGGYIYSYDVSIGGTDVVIPKVIKGIEIKWIGARAFNNKGITSVVFPEGLVELGDYAFANNPLTHLELPETLETLGRDAFSGGESIGDLIIPNSVKSIGIAAFSRAGLTSVKLSHNLTIIEPSCFSANKLLDVVIPEGVESIQKKAFQDNLSLKKVTLPNSLLSIGEDAFQLTAIDDLTFGDSITTIEARAFADSHIANIQFPTSLETIGNEAFKGNHIKELNILDSILSIGAQSFSNNSIESLSIGTGISVIPESCFSNNALKIFTIPPTVTEIGQNAFNINQLLTMTLPDTVTTLATNAFGVQRVPVGLSKRNGIDVKRMDDVSEELDLNKMVNIAVSWGTYDPIKKEIPMTRTLSKGYNIISYYYHIENTTITSDTALQVILQFDGQYDYQVLFVDYDDSVLDTQYVKYGQSAIEPALPTPPAHKTFKGWDKSFSSVTGEMTIKAVYEDAKYTVDYKEVNGDIIDTSEVEYNSLITEPMDPSKGGYEFKGWYADLNLTNKWDFGTGKVTDNMVLYAKWEAIPYTVSIQETQEKILRVQKDGINEVDSTNSFLPTITMQNNGVATTTDYSLLEWEVENITGFENYAPVCKVDKTTGKIIGLKSGVAKVTVKLNVGYDPNDPSTYDTMIIIVPGDVNKTGNVTMYDATIIMRSITQYKAIEDLITHPNKEYLDELADMNGDGNITVYDITIIGRMASQNVRPSN